MRLRFDQIRDEFALFLNRWPFEWFATLSFKYPENQEIGRDRLLQWARKICRAEGLQIAYIAVINKHTRIHLHVLMLGRSKFGKTLTDISTDRWEDLWGDNAEIDRIYNLSGLTPYCSENYILNDPDESDLIIFNRNLLKKLSRVELWILIPMNRFITRHRPTSFDDYFGNEGVVEFTQK